MFVELIALFLDLTERGDYLHFFLKDYKYILISNEYFVAPKFTPMALSETPLPPSGGV